MIKKLNIIITLSKIPKLLDGKEPIPINYFNQGFAVIGRKITHLNDYKES